MEKQSFNTDWAYSHLNEPVSLATVTLPHDAMLSEPRTADSPGGTNTGWFQGHDYQYVKNFFVPEEWNGQQIVFEFEGVYQRSEVYINGQKASDSSYGYSNFYVKANDYLRFGKENTIQVIAYNSDQPNSRWYTGAGIYRPVWLYRLPDKHIALNGIRIRTLAYLPPQIQVSVETSGAGPVKVEILDSHAVLASKYLTDKKRQAVFQLPDAVLWEPENPKLYTCRVTFGEDVREEDFGIRLIECDSSRGFCINGKRTILRGACIHHDNGLLGAVSHPFAEERKVRLLKENGYNAIRSAHNPCSKALLTACDRLGMLVVDEYVDMWYIHKTRYDYAGEMPRRWQQDLRMLVERDYNHPSVVMYSIGNEVSETAQAKGISLTRSMRDYLHELDDRPVTCGVNLFFNFLSSLGLGVYSDKKAAKEAAGGKKNEVGSAFYNRLAGLLGAEFMKFGATLPGSDIKTRDAFAMLDVAGYNYGINRYRHDLKKYPERVIVGSETFCSDAARFWTLAQEHPALIGDFVWTGIDYLGEVGLGAWEYREYAPDFEHGVGWLTAGSGRLDITGKPSGEAAYTLVVYGFSPIRIGVVPPDHAEKAHSPSAWRMTNTLESWAWNGCEGRKTQVEVYASGVRTELFLNGKSLGVRSLKECRAVFSVIYQPGELTAVAYDSDGRKTGRISLHSAKKETILRILPEQNQVTSDELCYARLRYTDTDGCWKPAARGKIRVNVSGGTLLGLGSGCPYCEEGYLNTTTDTYYGEAMSVIRPDGRGKITIHADSPFGSAEVQVICKEQKKSGKSGTARFRNRSK